MPYIVHTHSSRDHIAISLPDPKNAENLNVNIRIADTASQEDEQMPQMPRSRSQGQKQLQPDLRSPGGGPLHRLPSLSPSWGSWPQVFDPTPTSDEGGKTLQNHMWETLGSFTGLAKNGLTEHPTWALPKSPDRNWGCQWSSQFWGSWVASHCGIGMLV